jgi:hypothetical protein
LERPPRRELRFVGGFDDHFRIKRAGAIHGLLVVAEAPRKS